MSKNDQLIVNAIVKGIFDNLPSVFGVTPIRLYTCSALVYYTGRYTILKSYSTIIAVYDGEQDTLYDGLRYVYGYTATSAQHISKFKKFLPDRPGQVLTYRNV